MINEHVDINKCLSLLFFSSVLSTVPPHEFYGMKYDSVLNNLFLCWDVGLLSTEHAFNDKNVANFINSTDYQFDVIVLEQFFHDSWLPFAYKFNAPIVTIATLGHADYFDYAMGFMTPWSFVPHSVLTFNDNMSFSERVINVFWGLTDAILRRYYYMSRMQLMADKYFSHLEGDIIANKKKKHYFKNKIIDSKIVFCFSFQECRLSLIWKKIFHFVL